MSSTKMSAVERFDDQKLNKVVADARKRRRLTEHEPGVRMLEFYSGIGGMVGFFMRC